MLVNSSVALILLRLFVWKICSIVQVGSFFCHPLFIFHSERLDEALCMLNQNRELDESESEEEQTLW